MPAFARPGPFATELRAAGQKLIADLPGGRFADTGQILRAALFLIVALGIYGVILAGGLGLPLLLLALAGGLSAFMFGVSVAHDASHGALHRKPWVNRAALFFGFAIFGISGQLWGWRHTRVHHMYANVTGTEFDHEATEMLRLSPHSPWRPWHRFQPLYAPLFYAILFGAVTWILDYRYLRESRRVAPKPFATWQATAEFVATKVLHVLLMIVLPALCLDRGLPGLLAGYLVATCVPSLLFSALVVGTHIAEEATFHTPDETGALPHDWATHQMLTSVDWSPENRIAALLTGGANAHAAHHLFPNVAHCHMPALDKLVARKVAEHDIPRNLTSFRDLVRSHFRHLRTLSQQPDGDQPDLAR